MTAKKLIVALVGLFSLSRLNFDMAPSSGTHYGKSDALQQG